MTDARLPERYLMDRRIVRLSHAHRSSYFMATLWAVSNRTDGHIGRDDLSLIPTFDRSAIDALIENGLWAVTQSGWIDVEFQFVQTSKAGLEAAETARAVDRDRKRRGRAHARGEHSLCSSDNCDQRPRESPSFRNRPTPTSVGQSDGQHRIGQERQGEVEYSAVEAETAIAPCCGEQHSPLVTCSAAAGDFG